MKTIFLGSVYEHSGKSMVALGLAKNFKGKVGYYKPFRENVFCHNGKIVDRDAHMMKKALKLEPSEELLSPFTYDIFSPVNMLNITDGFTRVRGNSDVMIVEGAELFSTGALHHVEGMTVAASLGAEIILVSTSTLLALDKIAIYERLMEKNGQKLKGVILNMSNDPTIKGLLEKKGTRVLGCIPTAKELRHLRVKEIVESLNADVIAGEEGMEKTVEQVMVGAMTAEYALKGMRRVSRKAVITGGDRSDILMAALSTDTSCLILTGGLQPSKPVLAKADDLQVPVLLVGHSTMATAEMVDGLIARIDPDDVEKIDLIADLVRRHVNTKAVWEEE